ncbi:MAG: hypothetical protein ABW199_10770 [Caulobacterales bacterium]
MSLIELLFGRAHKAEARHPLAGKVRVLNEPPLDANWRDVRPRPDGTMVRAEKALKDGEVETKYGAMRYRAGDHYIVEHAPGERAVVRSDVFEHAYWPLGEGRFEKRTDIVYRYFIAPERLLVRTLEGFEEAQPGDWIMQGVADEMWPMRAETGRARYEPA